MPDGLLRDGPLPDGPLPDGVVSLGRINLPKAQTRVVLRTPELGAGSQSAIDILPIGREDVASPVERADTESGQCFGVSPLFFSSVRPTFFDVTRTTVL